MILSGAAEKHPERMEGRTEAPKPEGKLGEPPACFDPETQSGERLIAIWHEIVSKVPPGVLTSADSLHVELACRLTYRIRFENWKAKSGDFSQLKDILGKMAMNPADRSKVKIEPGAAIPAGAGVNDGNGDTSGAGGNAFRALAQKAAELRPN